VHEQNIIVCSKAHSTRLRAVAKNCIQAVIYRRQGGLLTNQKKRNIGQTDNVPVKIVYLVEKCIVGQGILIHQNSKKISSRIIQLNNLNNLYLFAFCFNQLGPDLRLFMSSKLRQVLNTLSKKPRMSRIS